MPPQRLTVAICAYTEDRWKDLVAAVESIRQQERSADQLIVVIDYNDRLLARARDAFRPDLVVANSGVRGLSGARNTAIAHAHGAVVAFLDDDAIAVPDWTTRLLAPYSDRRVLGVGGTAVARWDRGQPSWFPDEFLWVVGCSHRGLPTSLAQVRNLIGCNMSIRTDVLRRCGGFDTTLGRTESRPLGCEETELCIRAGELFPGGHFLLEPAAIVSHRVPGVRGSWVYFTARSRAEGTSKAWVAQRVGASTATATERHYATRTLPTGALRGVADAARGDLAGLARVGAILAGLAHTTFGFAIASLRRPNAAVATAPAAVPLRTFVIDRAEPIPTLRAGTTREGLPHRAAHCLVLETGRPVGTVVVEFEKGAITPAALDAAITHQFGDQSPPSSPRPHEHPTVTVVVATRNRPAELQRCLRSILDGSARPAQLIVVDNVPDDDATARVVHSLMATAPELEYVREDHPGLGFAHNTALAHVTGTITAFTDDDVVVSRQWLASLLAGFAEADDVGCVTGMITPLELDTPTQHQTEAFTAFNKGYSREVFHRSDTNRDPLFPYAAGMFGSGANMAFRTEALRSIGGFDNALGAGTIAMGGDDLAAFYDVIMHGYRLVYEPAAFVQHQHHRDEQSLSRQTYGYGAGLTAHLTRCVLNDAGAILRFARLSVRGLARAREIAKPKQPHATVPYPRQLVGRQIRGMLAGPILYIRSRRAAPRASSATAPTSGDQVDLTRL